MFGEEMEAFWIAPIGGETMAIGLLGGTERGIYATTLRSEGGGDRTRLNSLEDRHQVVVKAMDLRTVTGRPNELASAVLTKERNEQNEDQFYAHLAIIDGVTGRVVGRKIVTVDPGETFLGLTDKPIVAFDGKTIVMSGAGKAITGKPDFDHPEVTQTMTDKIGRWDSVVGAFEWFDISAADFLDNGRLVTKAPRGLAWVTIGGYDVYNLLPGANTDGIGYVRWVGVDGNEVVTVGTEYPLGNGTIHVWEYGQSEKKWLSKWVIEQPEGVTLDWRSRFKYDNGMLMLFNNDSFMVMNVAGGTVAKYDQKQLKAMGTGTDGQLRALAPLRDLSDPDRSYPRSDLLKFGLRGSQQFLPLVNQETR